MKRPLNPFSFHRLASKKETHRLVLGSHNFAKMKFAPNNATAGRIRASIRQCFIYHFLCLSFYYKNKLNCKSNLRIFFIVRSIISHDSAPQHYCLGGPGTFSTLRGNAHLIQECVFTICETDLQQKCVQTNFAFKRLPK